MSATDDQMLWGAEIGPFDSTQTNERRLLRRAMVRRFCRNRPALVSLVFLVLLIFCSIFATAVVPYNYATQNISNSLHGPSTTNWLGTDEYGRDVLSRIIVGSRVSLIVGVIAVALVLVIGVSVGLLAAYLRRLDGPLMRVVDLFLSIPDFLLLLLFVALFGTGSYKVAVFIGLSAWMSTSRIVRGQVLRLREMDFVRAAETAGAGTFRILRGMLRNVYDVIIVQATLTLSVVILLESALSYLGLGAQPPTPSWGNMLAEGDQYLRQAWWIATFPGLALFLTIVAINFVGDGIRDAFDVQAT
jgi:peptide/nickel transport system permease protein